MTRKRFNIILSIAIFVAITVIGIAIVSAVMLIFPEVAAYVM